MLNFISFLFSTAHKLRDKDLARIVNAHTVNNDTLLHAQTRHIDTEAALVARSTALLDLK